MTLACKHVDDIVIGAPFKITQDLITSLNISKIVKIINTKEDSVLKKHDDIDQFEIPRKLGMLEEISIDDDFYDMTTEKLAQRVYENKAAFELKFTKKNSSQSFYDSDKEYVEEIFDWQWKHTLKSLEDKRQNWNYITSIEQR